MEQSYQRLTWPLFLELIRLPAKAASLLPYLFGTLYAPLMFGQFDPLNAAIYFVGQMSIAFFVTGFNNVQDFYKAKDEHYRQTQNIIGRERLSPQRTLWLMNSFLAVACGCGLWLVARTDLALLLMGGAGIFVAIFYTYGPVPLSRIPCGELLAGLCEGFGTIFIATYINLKTLPVTLQLSDTQFGLQVNLPFVMQLFLAALPIVILDGTVMFADNICDLAQDVKNQRFTMPYYLSRDRALRVYPWLPRLAYALIATGALIGVTPKPMLLTLLLWPLVAKNTKVFLAKQDKGETFITAIRSLLLTAGAQVVVLLLCWLAW